MLKVVHCDAMKAVLGTKEAAGCKEWGEEWSRCGETSSQQVTLYVTNLVGDLALLR